MRDLIPTLGWQCVFNPYVDRIRIVWGRMRDAALQHFPTEPVRPTNAVAYLFASIVICHGAPDSNSLHPDGRGDTRG